MKRAIWGGAVTERLSEISGPQPRISSGTGHGHTGHTDMWQRISDLEVEVQELRQRHAAYDTLVRAGEAKKLRELGLLPQPPAPRRRRGRGHLGVIGGAVFLVSALSQTWTGTRGRHA